MLPPAEGVLLSWIREKNLSFIPTMILHLAVNAIRAHSGCLEDIVGVDVQNRGKC